MRKQSLKSATCYFSMVGMMVMMICLLSFPNLLTAATHWIWKVEPHPATMPVGGTLEFKAYDTGNEQIPDAELNWSVVTIPSGGAGTINEKGEFTATKAGEVTIRVTAKDNPSNTKTADVTIEESQQEVHVSPKTVTLREGEQQQFEARDENGNLIPNPELNWTVSNGIGNIGANGLFTATKAGSGEVNVNLKSDSTIKDYADVTVLPQKEVHVSPKTVTLREGEQQQFEARDENGDKIPDAEVNWTVENGDGGGSDTGKISGMEVNGTVKNTDSGDGTIDENGLFTATKEGHCTVKACLIENTNVCGTAQVIVGNEKNPPFGSFDTPINDSTVRSSIAVTGWALDDLGVDHVKIYRLSGNNQIYIGDAMLVEGARPDVAALYPEYPDNTRAGWGYMMLTNFLPNGGNGTFQIRAIATDYAAKTTTLGTKTIHCDNANAVKPFGAIDTPGQGGTASGSSFVNWGWALTPQPNHIPTDGSTLNVFVDSVNIGHPTYNYYREDIATLFPGYANSDGAAGLFSIDTTTFTYGVHTIYWTAQDSAGNTDGIGSRYFNINNSGTYSTKQAPKAQVGLNVDLSQIPLDNSEPVRVKKGFNRDVKPVRRYPDNNGIITFEIAELDRIEVRLFPERTAGLGPMYTGYQVIGNQLTSLPIGSTLDAKNGIFHWIPAHGFLGPFHLVFVETRPDGTKIKKEIFVEIVPRTAVLKGD